jgi:hypothetical protein
MRRRNQYRHVAAIDLTAGLIVHSVALDFVSARMSRGTHR